MQDGEIGFLLLLALDFAVFPTLAGSKHPAKIGKTALWGEATSIAVVAAAVLPAMNNSPVR